MAVVYFLKGRNYLLDDNYQRAIDEFKRVISINPDNIATWVNKGNSLDGLGRYGEAIESFDKAISIDPNYYPAWVIL